MIIEDCIKLITNYNSLLFLKHETWEECDGVIDIGLYCIGVDKTELGAGICLDLKWSEKDSYSKLQQMAWKYKRTKKGILFYLELPQNVISDLEKKYTICTNIKKTKGEIENKNWATFKSCISRDGTPDKVVSYGPRMIFHMNKGECSYEKLRFVYMLVASKNDICLQKLMLDMKEEIEHIHDKSEKQMVKDELLQFVKECTVLHRYLVKKITGNTPSEKVWLKILNLPKSTSSEIEAKWKAMEDDLNITLYIQYQKNISKDTLGYALNRKTMSSNMYETYFSANAWKALKEIGDESYSLKSCWERIQALTI